jgi:hypothetical protein
MSTRRLSRRSRSTSGYTANNNSSNGVPAHTVSLNKSLHPFLFMGCWNYTSPLVRGSAPRDAVLAAIADHEGDPLLVVAGDNAYPEKTKAANGSKKKVFLMDDIEEGFEQLKGSGKPLLIGIGNHNAERTPANGRSILKVERETFGRALPNPYFCRLFTKERKALVFLDTNAFEEEASHKLNALYENPDYVARMLEWLEEVVMYLRYKRYKFYLVQHEPMFSIKPKGYQRLHRGTHVLDIFDTARQYPIAILSADTHNHQELDLTYKGHDYRQVVVGTGGAIPDYMKALETMTLDESLKGEIKPFTSVRFKTARRNQEANYGYLEIVKSLRHRFYPVTGPQFDFKTDK